MKRKISLFLICTLIVLMIGGNQATGVSAGNSAFTYEGHLTENGNPVDGTYDFQFTLYDASNGGSQIGNVCTLEDIAVVNGLFSVSLDFGTGAFNGGARWLEMGVRPGDMTGKYTPRPPRQELSPAPLSEFPGGGRSDHVHLGQTWTGSSPLIINGAYENAPLILSNDIGHGLRVVNVDGAGVMVDSATGNGIRVNSAGGNGFRVDSAGGNGLQIGNAGNSGVTVNSASDVGLWVGSAGTTGLWVDHAGEHGVGVGSANDVGFLVGSAATGLYVVNAGGNAIGVESANDNGLYIAYAGGNGMAVNTANYQGVYVGSAGDNGFYVAKAGNAGVAVDTATAHGLTVGNAGVHGVVVNSAGNVGFYVGSAGDHGLYVVNAGVHGVAVDSAGAEGLYVGSAGQSGLLVGSAGADGVYVKNASLHGVSVDSTGQDGLLVRSAGTNGLSVQNAGADGVHVDTAGGYAGWFGGSIYARDGCVGCTITVFGVNAGNTALQPGDIVSIQGLLPGQFAGVDTLMQVKAAANGETVIGVVQGLAEVSGGAGSQQDRLVPRQGTVEPGGYVTIIIYGPAQVKASALSGTITAGTRLTLGDDGGVRTLKTTEVNGVQIAESASTIGIALEQPGDNELIWVLVNPQ